MFRKGDMAKPVQRRPFRLRRICFWCALLLLVAVLVVAAFGIYLRKVGLPDFLKRPLLAQLHAKGVQLNFTRARWHWHRGIVVDDAALTFLKSSAQPQFSFVETDVNLDLRSLLDSRVHLNSVTVKKGIFVWPISKTNHTSLSFSNIAARIEFPSENEIRFEQLEGDFADVPLKISGTVTNFADARQWKIFQPRKKREGKGALDRFAETMEKIHLAGNSKLTLDLAGDAADPKSIRALLRFSTAEIATPWGAGTNLSVTARIQDWETPGENNFIRVRINSARTPWGSASNFNGIAKLSSPLTNATFATELKISAKQLHAELGQTASIQFAGRTEQSLTNLIPSNIRGKTQLLSAETKWGKAESAEIIFSAATNTAPKRADETWAGWQKAEPFLGHWEMRLIGIETPRLQIEKLSSAGSWLAPELRIADLNAELFEGEIAAKGILNVATREAGVKGSSDFDVQKISPLLTPFGQRWLAKYTWEKPPQLGGELHVILPAWTNHAANWREEVLPTLEMEGQVSVERGSYRDVPVDSAKTDFTYSNRVWTLPHLRVKRPEGGAELTLVASDRAHDFHWRIQSEIDPKAIRQLLGEPQQRVLDDFKFTTPPKIRAELKGHWNEISQLSGEGEIALNNFSYRGNLIDKLTSSLQLTNQHLRAEKLSLESAGKIVSTPEISLDFPTKRLFFTNLYSTVDPYLVAGLIGKKVAATLAPYRFSEPPAIRVNGGFTIGKIEEADLHFLVQGTQFEWMRFVADKISGQVDWVGLTLLITNLDAGIYHGHAVGWSYFQFQPDEGAEYRFDLAVADIDLQSAVKSLEKKTNRLEGILHGQMTLASGNTRDLKTLRGHGRVNVRDGLLWDVPLFGIFSPILNAIVPGAGHSRAREASATFLVGDGNISSDDMEIRAPSLRMQYRGRVDFEQRIEGRVEAELLRDTWVIGRLVSLALTPLSKLFEYKVSGTLSHPEREPVYIPNFLMMTLRPFHSMKKAFTPDKTNPTPASTLPPEKKP